MLQQRGPENVQVDAISTNKLKDVELELFKTQNQLKAANQQVTELK